MLIAPALRSPTFRRFWLAQLISTTGTALQVVAEGWLIYQVTRSTFWLGMVGFLALLPVLPVSLVGGLLIDRLPRRKVILVTQSCLLIQAAIFGLLATFGVVQLWHLLVLYCVFGAILAIDHPARRAFLVELVPAEDLGNAVALNATLFNVASFVGYAIGGILIATIGVGSAMLLNAASYLAPIMVLITLRVADVSADAAPIGVTEPSRKRTDLPGRTSLSEGLWFLWRQPILIGVIGLMAVVGGLTNPVFGLMPAYALDVLQTDALGLGILMAIGAFGSVIGTVVVAQFGKQPRALLWIGLLLPVLIVTFSFVRDFWVACLLVLLMGAGLLVLQSLAITQVQLAIPDRVRGRVMTLYSILHAGSDTGGAMVIGWLALYLSLPLALSVGAICAAIYTLVYAYAPSFAAYRHAAALASVDGNHESTPR